MITGLKTQGAKIVGLPKKLFTLGLFDMKARFYFGVPVEIIL
jgi:hypothetical protein